MKSWQIVVLLLLCLVLTGSMACTAFGDDSEEEAAQRLVEVVRGDLTVSVNGSGSVDVSREVRLTFGSSGKIDRIFVDDGDKVTEGEVLARLDTAALELSLTQAEVALAQAQTARVQAQAAQVQAQATQVQAQTTLDEAEYNLKQLEMFFSPFTEQVKLARAQLGAAQAQLEATQAQLEAAQAQFGLAEMQIEAAEQALEEAQKQLDETTITAPFDGVVASVDVDEKDTVSTTITIIHLIDPSSMELEVQVDEIDVPEVKPGQRAIIEVDALPALPLEGEVSFISLLPTEEAGVTVYNVTIRFDVPEGIGLKIGMSADADIIIAERNNVLLVPDRAIKQDSQGNTVVEVMVNEQIEERAVVIGISDSYQTEIVDGLDEGELVVRKAS